MSISASNAPRRLLVLAMANATFFAVEAGTAVSFGWFSAFFDALDFFERAVVLAILATTPLWSLRRRYAVTAAVILTGIIAVTAGAYYLWPRGAQHGPLSLMVWLTVAVGSIALNVVSFVALRSFRGQRSTAGRIGYLAARADIWSSIAVFAAAIATYALRSRWPDIIASIFVVTVHLAALGQTVGERRTKGHDDMGNET